MVTTTTDCTGTTVQYSWVPGMRGVSRNTSECSSLSGALLTVHVQSTCSEPEATAGILALNDMNFYECMEVEVLCAILLESRLSRTISVMMYTCSAPFSAHLLPTVLLCADNNCG